MLNKLLITILSLYLLTFSQVSTYASTNTDRPIEWGTVVNKAYNFYQISPLVFRSEQPTKELIPLLKQHNINIVINLRTSDKDKKTLKDTDIQLVHVPIRTWAISKEDLLQVMKAIQNAQKSDQKVLIHCYHGSDRTGASIAMYRIIFENWTIDEALNEMKNGGYGFHSIWTNIEKLFTPENIKWIQQELSNPS